jgi:hypothetical protein
MIGAIVLAILSICVAATFGKSGRHRTILASCTAGLAVLAVGAGLMSLADSGIAVVFMSGFMLGFIAFQLLANAFATK